jgi:hypothetical protein
MPYGKIAEEEVAAGIVLSPPSSPLETGGDEEHFGGLAPSVALEEGPTDRGR